MAISCLRLSTMPAQAQQMSSVPAPQWSGSNPSENIPLYLANASTTSIVPLALCAKSLNLLPAVNLTNMPDMYSRVPPPGQCCMPSTSLIVFLIATLQR